MPSEFIEMKTKWEPVSGQISSPICRRIAVAPMMELTDRHFRFLLRLLTRHSLLYTEMLTSKAVLHGDRDYLLGMQAVESPVVLQLGGSDPAEMAAASKIGEAWGYCEINMNVGCPSDRVKSGRFGACLMAEPDLVAACFSAMQAAVAIPVSVKCRLGIDRDDSYLVVEDFVRRVSAAGCRYFIVHARKAWLDGLSPKQNRTVPPLRYEYVYRLKQAFPDLHITINGGIESWDAVQDHLQHVDAVMLGRKAYHDPAFMSQADALMHVGLADTIAPMQDIAALASVARNYARYMQSWSDKGVRISALSRHLLALFQQVPGARQWRRHLSEQAGRTSDAIELVENALSFVELQAARNTALNTALNVVKARSA